MNTKSKQMIAQALRLLACAIEVMEDPEEAPRTGRGRSSIRTALSLAGPSSAATRQRYVNLAALTVPDAATKG